MICLVMEACKIRLLVLVQRPLSCQPFLNPWLLVNRTSIDHQYSFHSFFAFLNTKSLSNLFARFDIEENTIIEAFVRLRLDIVAITTQNACKRNSHMRRLGISFLNKNGEETEWQH
jgi:hypothetical protein